MDVNEIYSFQLTSNVCPVSTAVENGGDHFIIFLSPRCSSELERNISRITKKKDENYYEFHKSP